MTLAIGDGANDVIMIQVGVLLFLWFGGTLMLHNCWNDRLLILVWALRDRKGCRQLIRRICIAQVRFCFPCFFLLRGVELMPGGTSSGF